MCYAFRIDKLKEKHHDIDVDESGDGLPISRCPYLPEQKMRLEAGLALHLPAADFDHLLVRGFRRSGLMLYVPNCPSGCRQCIPIRVPVDRFAPSRSQRRVERQCRDLVDVRVGEPRFDQAHVELHNRHAPLVSPDNTLCSESQYGLVFVDSCVQTHLIEYWIEDKLVGLSTLDEGLGSLSSVYFCWDPEFAKLSLGTYSAIWELAWAKERGLQYYYLGYWVEQCPSMAYKANFGPHEMLDWASGRWRCR